MKTIQLDDLATSLFCRDMAMLLAAGTQPDEALALLCGDAGGEARFSAAVGAMAAAMRAGKPFSEAVRAQQALPDYAAHMIAAGETAGRTEQVLNRLADYYERQHALRRRLRGALVYPMFLLLLMCGILAFLVWKVVPVFLGVYDSLSGSLAGSSYAYAAAARAVSWTALVVTLAVCAALAVSLLLSRTPQGTARLARLLETFPATAGASRRLAVSRLTDALATFTASGLDPDTALREAGPMVTHRGLHATVQACMADLAAGQGLAQALCARQVFPPLYGRMLESGSRAGKLDETLARLADLTGQDAEQAIYAAVEAVEPALTGFLTVAVGATLLAAMLPLVGILGSIGG
jgi:type IV pilus assembly protein PilC